MAVRTPLLLNAPPGEPQFQIQEMDSGSINNVHAFAPYAYGNNSLGPSAKLEVNTANGTLMSGQPFVDTYYIAGAYTTRVDRFSTEAETPNISMVTDNYNRLRVVYDSTSLPTGDTNNLQYPLYLYNTGSGADIDTHLRTMSRQDFIDTFVLPALSILDVWSASTTNQQQGTYFLTTSASPANATLVSSTPVAVNSQANVAAYTSSGIPEAQKQTLDTNYYLARVNYPPTSYAVYDSELGKYDLPLYIDAGTEQIRQHTPTSWANLLGPWLRYYLATSGSGYDIIYSLSSGNQRGSTYTDTRVVPTGTGYTTRYVNTDDYRTQEFPTGTATTITANTKRFYISRGGIPTYGASSNPSGSVNEGSSVTFTLTTTNVLDGSTFPYSITGITAADISSGSLSGNVTISSNSGSTTITLVKDGLTEGETATCTFTTPGGDRVVAVTVGDADPNPALTTDLVNATADGSPNAFAIARFNLLNTGVAQHVWTTFTGTIIDPTYNWLDDMTNFNAADWEVYVTVNAGTINAGSDATDTWLSLSTNRSWYNQVPYTDGTITGTIIVTIREVANTSNSASASITLEASGIA